MEMICVAECTAINKKSKASGFKDLRIGDVMTFSIYLQRAGKNGGRTLASYIDCKNVRTGEKGCWSFNEIDRYINGYEFEQLNEVNEDDYKRD